jgi:hypothetical protein
VVDGSEMVDIHRCVVEVVVRMAAASLLFLFRRVCNEFISIVDSRCCRV